MGTGKIEIAVPVDATDDDFDRWYRRLAPRVMRALVGMTGDSELARDLTADAFVQALRRWDHVSSDVHSPDDWVFTVAINLARRHHRRRRLTARTLPVIATAKDTAGLRSADVDLWRAVADLPTRQREVVVLRYLADRTEAEVARTLGLSEGAVSATLAKARAALRVQLTRGASDD